MVVGEGPGHQRDTKLVLFESGFEEQLGELKLPFVDLNRDELIKTPLLATYTGMEHLWLPRTILESDFVVSMPKVKAHHWSGVTLSMKNMFGVVPGTRYGWPKNILHWKGIQESILDVCATVPNVLRHCSKPQWGMQPWGHFSMHSDDMVSDLTLRGPHGRLGSRIRGPR